MAAATSQVVCPFFGVVFERLDSLINNVQMKKLGPLVKAELTKLFKSFLKIKEVLDDAEEKQFNEKAVRVRFWLQELNGAAYEADDVFDEFEYEALQQAEGVSSSNNVTEKLNGKIQKLIVIFGELAEECSGLELQKGKEKSVVVSPDRITSSFLTEPQVYGRDGDRKKLVQQIVGPTSRAKHPDAGSSSSKDAISVFPILGMGGLGKTTLAQLVYNDKRVENHFKHRSWICVSDDFDIKRLMKAIIASISGSECELEDLEPLQQRFREEVHGERFLLVLDDVWEESQAEWNKMMGVFKGGAQGSSIIVTTRLPTVASITSKLPPYCLNSLSKKDCWALFKQYAFGPGNEEREALVTIGEAIVEKCGGLPLAAKAMGGLLRFKNEENEWNEVKDSAIWELPQRSEKDILPALRLSYYHLPSKLKQCFVYCSIFPKDFNIGKERLIQLWIANGLVQCRPKIELEDVGNETFTALLQRSFFQDIEKDEDGGIMTCKMHDLVHDLASYIAGDEYVVEGVESARNITERTRHLSLLSHQEIPPTSIHESMLRSWPCLRSLIRLSERTATLNFDFSKFIFLRALDLHSCKIEVVPDRISDMIHLRYLNLSDNRFALLPESVCLLRNMQTLDLRWCHKLESLPKDFGNMSNLRHLDIYKCDRLSGMPISIRQLTCLRRLSHFIVGKGSRIGGLQSLNNLRGRLIITELQLVETSMDARGANLMSKKNLHTLDLHWTRRSDSLSDLNVMEGLQPHSNLRNLEVQYYRGVTLSPSWLTEASLAPNLEQLSLWRCTCQHLGSLRKLPRLRVLKLFGMDSLRFIEVDDSPGGFLSLEELSLNGLPDLEGWSRSSSQAASAEEVLRWLEGLRLEEQMRDVEGSSSSRAAATTPTSTPAAAVSPRPKSSKKFERSQKLKIEGAPLSLSPSSLSQAPITQQVPAVFPRLKSVRIDDCPKLKGGIPLALSPVQHVEINGKNCNEMVLASLRDLPSLPSLQINEFRDLERFPSGTLTNLTALRKLYITRFDNLKTLPVELYRLATLTELQISNCPKLVSFAKESEGGHKNLSSLKILEISHCGALKRLPELNKACLVALIISCCPEMEFSEEDFEHFRVLEKLCLYELPKLTCFPEGIKHSAKTLRYLQIQRHSRLDMRVDLPDWIGTTLTSLEYLEIYPPMNWKVLPQWMRRLTALKQLKIYRCDEELVERWRNRDEQREEDYCFSMISHVPDVKLTTFRRYL